MLTKRAKDKIKRRARVEERSRWKGFSKKLEECREVLKDVGCSCEQGRK